MVFADGLKATTLTIDRTLVECEDFTKAPVEQCEQLIYDLLIWVFPKIVVPQNEWFIMENPF